jgi:DNA gyrase subunit A
MVVTVSHAGYIKRVPLSTYRAQKRGGRGRAGMATREEDFVAQVFVASTHTPVLFFTNSGRAYKLKVWRLPLGTPQARGRPIIQLLQNVQQGEGISAVLPLPEDDAGSDGLTVVFATASGHVRRNSLADFAEVKANGKIAMKFEGEDANDRLVGVALATERDDVLLATRKGRAIRFPVSEVRVFAGRASIGVRGIRLDKGDTVISMTVLQHVELGPEEREAYLAEAARRRRAAGEEAAETVEPEEAAAAGAEDEEEKPTASISLSEERFAELAALEQMLLSVTEKGFGMRTSAHDYRITLRGGKGIRNVVATERRGTVVDVFPVERSDQLMIVTDGGTMIRTAVDDVRLARRPNAGVILFRVGDGERVVSAARLADTGAENGGEGEPVSVGG